VLPFVGVFEVVILEDGSPHYLQRPGLGEGCGVNIILPMGTNAYINYNLVPGGNNADEF
jgi:hypothetical protein